MQHHRRAHQVRRCDIVLQRPGIAKAVIMPVKLRRQNNPDQKISRLNIHRQGKTLVGGTQWAYKKLRPGLARPLMVATQATNHAEKKAAQADGNSEAAPVMTPKAKPLSGWWR